MKLAYFDCFSGISGDMCLGAIVDAGVPLKSLRKELWKIPVKGYKLHERRVKRSNLTAMKVDVVLSKQTAKPPLNKWDDIKALIQRSSLSQKIKQKGLKIFRRIFEAEAVIHGKALKTVHLHELGAIDAVMDIFGTIIGLDLLGIGKVYSSPVNLGSGIVKTSDGIIPIPAPATVEILKNTPVYSNGLPFELTTPTGAAIIKEISYNFGDIPLAEIEKTGIGAGNRDLKDWPNVLRIFISGDLPSNNFQDIENITVIETNIDDMNPQIFEYVVDMLYKAGALDVYLTQVIMKKGRPGILMTVLCNNKIREKLIHIILGETSTIGLRFFEVKRRILQRYIKRIETDLGSVRVKFSITDKDKIKATPEYEDCKKIARKHKLPLTEVMNKIKQQI